MRYLVIIVLNSLFHSIAADDVITNSNFSLINNVTDIQINELNVIELCDKSFYNSTTEICCNNQVIERPLMEFPSDAMCCGIVAFNPNTHGCCIENDVKPLPKGIGNWKEINNRLNCCDSQPYNQNTQACCHGVVSRLPPGLFEWTGSNIRSPSRCCRSQPINKNMQGCCDGMVTSLPLGLGNWDLKRGQCCRGKAYNILTHECSGQKIVEKDLNSSEWTCNSIKLDMRSETCCNSTVVSLAIGLKHTEESVCCGRNSMNSRRHVCCENDTLSPLPSGLSDAREAMCCGEQAINPHTSTCCNKKVVPLASGLTQSSESKCCGKHSWNTLTHSCCDDQLKSLPKGTVSGIDGHCCGKYAYDKRTHVCCNQTLIPLTTQFYGNVFCCGNSLYDARTHGCCKDFIVPLPNHVKTSKDKHFQCCGYEIFDNRTDICCENNLEKLPLENKGNISCCGKKSYNRRMNACCKTTENSNLRYTVTELPDGVEKWSEDSGKCCAEIPYDARKKICCKQELIDGNSC